MPKSKGLSNRAMQKYVLALEKVAAAAANLVSVQPVDVEYVGRELQVKQALNDLEATMQWARPDAPA